MTVTRRRLRSNATDDSEDYRRSVSLSKKTKLMVPTSTHEQLAKANDNDNDNDNASDSDSDAAFSEEGKSKTEIKNKTEVTAQSPAPIDLVASCTDVLRKCAPNGLTARELSLQVDESPNVLANKLNSVLDSAPLRKSLAENSRRNVYYFDDSVVSPLEEPLEDDIPLNSPKSVADNESHDESHDHKSNDHKSNDDDSQSPQSEKDSEKDKRSAAPKFIVPESLPLSPPPDSTLASQLKADNVVVASLKSSPNPNPNPHTNSNRPSTPPVHAHMLKKNKGQYLTTTTSRFMTTSLITEPNPYYDDVFSSVVMTVDDWAWACNDAEMDNLMSPESISLNELDEMLL